MFITMQQAPVDVMRCELRRKGTERIQRAFETAERLGLVPLDVARSRLVGPAGNREFFAHLGVPDPAVPDRMQPTVRTVIAARIAECTAA